jgi:LAO/AO transport system kinase
VFQGVDTEALRQGQRRALAKGITLIESSLERDRQRAQDLLEKLAPDTGKSVRIGISGVPGVGKSTFIEAFGLHLLAQGRRVAVLAVDPSSPLGGGSILGDKTRMELLSRADGAFIRPSPTGGALGGVAQKTRESLLLCEAAGFDVVLVETVGVGQSEFQVAGMVDFFMVLMLPNAGDELQGIKRGIIELADALVINKADSAPEAAERSRQQYDNALKLLRRSSFWQPTVTVCSALRGDGVAGVWQQIAAHHDEAVSNGHLQRRRAEQNRAWLYQLIDELLHTRLRASSQVRKRLQALELEVAALRTTPYRAACEIVNLL